VLSRKPLYRAREDLSGALHHGNELWEFDENGLMKRRDASINDYKIEESERKFRWNR
jgi:nuclear transport factor 2 (NTF2) superfamily protein